MSFHWNILGLSHKRYIFPLYSSIIRHISNIYAQILDELFSLFKFLMKPLQPKENILRFSSKPTLLTLKGWVHWQVPSQVCNFILLCYRWSTRWTSSGPSSQFKMCCCWCFATSCSAEDQIDNWRTKFAKWRCFLKSATPWYHFFYLFSTIFLIYILHMDALNWTKYIRCHRF